MLSKKRFIGLAPLLSLAAFAVMPVVAQAEAQHWYRNGAKLAEGTAVPIVMFGGKINLEWNNALGGPNCRTVAAGTIENPVGGGAGVGRTNSMTFYECKQPACEEEVKAKTGMEGRLTITSQNNPAATKEPGFPGWSNVLEESEIAGVLSVREKIGEPWGTYKNPSPPGMIRQTESCIEIPNDEAIASAIVEGELRPEIGIAKKGNLNGTSASKPSSVRFEGASTGTTHSELAGETTNQGQLKYLGYNEQELITVKP